MDVTDDIMGLLTEELPRRTEQRWESEPEERVPREGFLRRHPYRRIWEDAGCR
jgi:hypothetical protein